MSQTVEVLLLYWLGMGMDNMEDMDNWMKLQLYLPINNNKYD